MHFFSFFFCMCLLLVCCIDTGKFYNILLDIMKQYDYIANIM